MCGTDGTGYGEPTAGDPEYQFRKGDRICFKLRVNFAPTVYTRDPVVTDFLPVGTSYVPGSMVLTIANREPSAFDEGKALAGELTWTVGTTRNGVRYANPGGVFEAVFSVLVDDPAPPGTVDILGNAMKLRTVDAQGRAQSLRDLLDFEIVPAVPLRVLKGVEQVDTPTNGPNGVNSNVDGIEVREVSRATFRIDITNVGVAGTATGYGAGAFDVWDVLPEGITCSQISNATGPIYGSQPTITCYDTNNPNRPDYADRDTRALQRWTYAFDPNAPAQSQGIEPTEVWTLTYDMVIPRPTSVGRTFANDAYVHQYAALTNTPGQTATFYPQDNVDQSLPSGEENAPAASDPSNVFTAAVVVAKSGTTSLTEANNNQANEATIGEAVTYTYSVTIPAGTSVFAGALTDALPAGFVPTAPATAEFCAPAPPPGDPCAAPAGLPAGVTLDTSTGTLTFGGVYDNVSASGQRFSVTIPVQVTDGALDAASNNEDRSNTAEFTSTVTDGGSAVDPVRATYTINVRQPRAVVTKTNSTSGPVVGGASVTFTVTARNENVDGTSTNRPPLHDAVVIDCLPPELTLDLGSLTDGATSAVGDGSNGCLDGWTKITWLVGDVAPGGAVARTYTATVTPSAVGGDSYVNTATLTGTSMPGVVPGERTYSAAATSTVAIRGAALTKSVDRSTLTIGETATWTLTATTAPNVTYYGASFLDSVPAGFTDITTLSATCRTLLGADCTSSFPLLGQALTPSPASPLDGSQPVTYGWLVGDIPGDGGVRTFRLTYDRTRRRCSPAATPGCPGPTRSATGWIMPPTPADGDAGQAFDRRGTSRPP